MTLEQVLEPLVGQGMLAALPLTFLGGIVASGVCPCTVPMGLGVAGLAGASEARSRYAGLQVAIAFFAGIVLSLTALGSLAGQLGALATESFGRRWALGIADALHRLDGVEAVNGEPKKGLITVRYLTDRADPAGIAEVIAQRGFDSAVQP